MDKNTEYNHEEVLKENTRPPTDKEVKKLRVFAAGLIVCLALTFVGMSKYGPKSIKDNMHSNYRMSWAIDSYDSI